MRQYVVLNKNTGDLLIATPLYPEQANLDNVDGYSISISVKPENPWAFALENDQHMEVYAEGIKNYFEILGDL